MKVATGEGWGTTERYSLGARQPNGALVAVKEDTAAVTKLLLVCLVTKSGKVIVGLLLGTVRRPTDRAPEPGRPKKSDAAHA